MTHQMLEFSRPAKCPGWLCWVVGLLLAGAVAASAAPLPRDLGHGLVYFRLPPGLTDLPANPAGRAPPCVVDVRFRAADDQAASRFREWLLIRATRRSPVFVLVNSDTSASLFGALSAHKRGSGIVVVGAASGPFKPDVAVQTSAENERRAYDALEAGTPLSVLLTDHPDKVRNDEASLAKDRLTEAAADPLASKRSTTPVDVTLQRAVHLHRAVVALKKI